MRDALERQQQQRHRQHRRRQHHDDAGGVERPDEHGSRYQVMPGARRRWMVTMKFSPVTIEEKPEMKMPTTASDHVALGIVGGERRVEGPAGIDAAGEQRGQQRSAPPAMNRYQLSRLSLGKARSRAPIISGTRKLPSMPGPTGTRKNHTMMMPCMVNSRL